MIPQEKAIELYSKYYNRIEHTLSEEYSPHEKDIVKQCVLVAVNEILEDNRTSLKLADDENLHPHARGLILGSLAIWLEVKTELEKI